MISKIFHQRTKPSVTSRAFPIFFSKCCTHSHTLSLANPDPLMRAFRTCSSSTIVTTKYYPRFTRNVHKIEKAATPAQQKQLFEKLAMVRKKISSQEHKPIFVIFNNKQLKEMAKKKPKTVEEFKELNDNPIMYALLFIEAIKSFDESKGKILENPFTRHVPEPEEAIEPEPEQEEPARAPPKAIKPVTIKTRRRPPTTEQLLTRLNAAGVTLSKEQEQLLATVLSGKNVFLTGSAGTGKSFIIRELVKMLPTSTTVVTASTGIAAVNLGGVTIHSFAGIGTGGDSIDIILDRVRKKRAAVKRWRDCEVLIIDEISMISASLFTKLERVAREIRGVPQAFGGLQVILCGDFFQLPPVDEPAFAFESPAWDLTIKDYIDLKQIFRQSDLQFVRHLNEVRIGKVLDECRKRFMQCLKSPFTTEDGILPTQLFPLKASVLLRNTEQLAKLPGKAKVFNAQDGGRNPFLRELQTSCPAPAKLELKVNTQVLLVKNLDAKMGLVNGSRGVVVGFSDTGFPVVKFANCEVEITPVTFNSQIKTKTVAWRKQIPLAYGWALSIHKSQGMTLDRSTISLRDVFSPGQAYVALSRVRSMNHLHLLDFNANVISCDIKVCQFYEAKFGVKILPDGISTPPKDPALEAARKKLEKEIQEEQVIEEEEDDE